MHRERKRLVDLLIDDLIDLSAEPDRRRLWLRMVLALPAERIRQAMAETRAASLQGEIRGNVGAYLVARLEGVAAAVGIELGLRPATGPRRARRPRAPRPR